MFQFMQNLKILKCIHEETSFNFATQTDIEGQIENLILPIIGKRATSNFYFNNFAKIIVSDLNATFVQSTSATNNSTGYLQNTNQVVKLRYK